MRFHLAMRVAEFRQRGMSDADAHAEALRHFGDPEEFRAYSARRATRRVGWHGTAQWFGEWGQDVRIATRQFRNAPRFVAIAVLTLALGIGANAAVFSVVYHLLLAPLPYPDGNRIVALEVRPVDAPDVPFGLGTAVLDLWRARTRSLVDVSAYVHSTVRVGAETAHDSLTAAYITPTFLPMLRVRPAIGRGFSPSDARRGAPPVMMIGHGLWQTRFGGARDVVGKVARVDGIERTIVGVLPPGLRVPMVDDDTAAVWLPFTVDSARRVDAAFARLRPRVTSADASRELQSIVRQLPDTGWLKGARARARTAAELLGPRERNAIEILFIAAAALLVIACANVASLLLMRSWNRQREFAIRRALGAGRPRLARQLLTEGVMLAAMSGALGILIAWLGLRVILAMPVPPGALTDLTSV